jgi:hypothetical protein
MCNDVVEAFDRAQSRELVSLTSVYLPKQGHCFLNKRSAKEVAMKNLMCTAAVAVAAMFAVVSVAPTDAFAAGKRSAYAAKEAACKGRASHMKFGVHFVKRHRWIKECIAGAA